MIKNKTYNRLMALLCLGLLSSNASASDNLGEIVIDSLNRTICNCTQVVLDAINDYAKDHPGTTDASSLTPATVVAITGVVVGAVTLLAGPIVTKRIKSLYSWCRPSFSDPTMMNTSEILTKAGDEKFNAEFTVLGNRLSIPSAIAWIKTPIYTPEPSCLRNPIRFLVGYKYSHANGNGAINDIYLIGSNEGRERKDKRRVHAIGSINVDTVDQIFLHNAAVIAHGGMNATAFRDHIINLPSIAPLFADHAAVRAQISSILDYRTDPIYRLRINVSSINTGITINLNSGGAPDPAVQYRVHIRHTPAPAAAAAPIILAPQPAAQAPWIWQRAWRTIRQYI